VVAINSLAILPGRSKDIRGNSQSNLSADRGSPVCGTPIPILMTYLLMASI